MKALEKIVEHFDQLYQDHGMSSQRMYPNESLIQFVANRYFRIPKSARKDIRILEVGCGSGANLWFLSKEEFDTYGVDSSQKGLELAELHLREKWNVVANLCHGSFTELPYDDSYFDVVVDVVSLQHMILNDVPLALQEIHRVLRPKGVFFSYRLSDHSVMYENSGGNFIDPATVDNISDTTQPLYNCGPVAFWSPTLTRMMYQNVNLSVDTIERIGRTYANGSYVEYLAITSTKK